MFGGNGGLVGREAGYFVARFLVSISLAKSIAWVREDGLSMLSSWWISFRRPERKQLRREVGERPVTRLERDSNCCWYSSIDPVC